MANVTGGLQFVLLDVLNPFEMKLMVEMGKLE